MSIINLCTHSLFAPSLSSESVVIDCGAHRGGFSMEIIHHFGSKCFAIEASPEICSSIPIHSKIQKFNFALAPNVAEVDLCIRSDPLSTGIAGLDNTAFDRIVRVPAMSLLDFCKNENIEHIDLLKLDIEGVEIALLDATPDDFLAKIGQLTIEFHDHYGLTTRQEVERIVNRIQALGFFLYLPYLRVSYVDTLLINRRLLSRTRYLWLKYGRRSFLGIRRKMAGLFRRSSPD